ncbi:membrane protein insertion efficiency factor YidD [Candidatus Sumerlaeota bacterium]|nr:membrane protein insertion efficiency factor YidD [Candidatus Sumerlaeota bacterium]
MNRQNKTSYNSAQDMTRLFLNDENRVRTRAEFLHVYQHATPIKQRGVAVFVINRNDSPTQTKLGITASKKTIGKAYRRNRLRRQVREIFRLTLPELKPGHTVIVNLTRQALKLDTQQLRTSLHIAWHKAGLFITDTNDTPPQPGNGTPTVARIANIDANPGSDGSANADADAGADGTCRIRTNRILEIIEAPFRFAMLFLVKTYRLLISPIMPPICRFHPSCSAYGLECLQTLPFHKALPLLIWRIMRCNPFCQGGYDPVPNGKHKKQSGE